jgi:hypothetical protein
VPEAFIHPSRRYRLYFDETGTGDLKAQKDENQRYLSVTGLVFRQDIHDTTFTTRLSAFKRRIFNDSTVALHRREIIDRVGRFAALNGDILRTEFNNQFANLVEYLPGPAFTVSIDEAEGSRGLEVDNRAFRSMRFEFEPECPQGKPIPPLSHVLRRSAGIESALN